MTNKTITLSRELVERIVKTCPSTLLELDYQELRAALAEPVPPVEFVQGHPPSCRAADEYKPGECGHGCEPVPPAGEAQQVHTDCRSEEGITVGLVDTVINCARLLKSRPTTAAVEYALQDLRADEDVAALVADPVPPAGGEVEVKRGILIDEGYGEIWMDWGADSCMDRNEGPYVLASDFDKHVTQLQAEVEHWRNRSAQWKERVAELTKARELLAEWLSSNFTGSCPERNDLRCRTDYALSNQSSPADKAQVNPEHTLFNEIRISEPVNEDGEPTRYLITEVQLQRIRALETDKGQGEPMVWIAESSEPAFYLSGSESTASAVAEHYREKGFEASVAPLYRHPTVQPAPVAVVMPDDIVRDAERYRILRDGGIPSTGIGDDYLGGVYVWDQRGEKYQECGKEISGDGLDACLDEAARLNNLK